MGIYRRPEEGDQGTILYLFTFQSSYYLVARPYLCVLLHAEVTFTHNNLCQALQGLAALDWVQIKIIVC